MKGEEIGMSDVKISWNDTVDPQACITNATVFEQYSRDPVRTPFQWDDSKNAGFSTGNKTWLPISPNYKSVNVKIQKMGTKSHLKVFQKLCSLRKDPSFNIHGAFEPKLISNDILTYKRYALCFISVIAPILITLTFKASCEFKSIFDCIKFWSKKCDH